MKNDRRAVVLLGIVIVCLLGGILWTQAPRGSSNHRPKVSFYQDSMHPWIKSDHLGKCTICAMDLTPIYDGEAGLGVAENLIVLSSNSISVANVQTEEVQRRTLRRSLRVAGTLEANESRKAIVAAPAPCRIQTLSVEYAGVEVEEGQILATLFSPELVQKRGYLRAVGGNQPGVSNHTAQMAMAVSDLFSSDLAAPQSGTVVERNVYPGQYVSEGEKMLTIADASVLWFRFDVSERQMSWLALGQKIQVTVPAAPGKEFAAVLSFIEPTLSDATRAVKVRADIANPKVTSAGHPHRLLRFGMSGEGRLSAEVPGVLAIERSAVLYPGHAAYAYVARDDGAFERRRLKLGRQGDEFWEILHGLEEGERVVTSGNVLMDAQAQFNQGHMADLEAEEDPAPAEPGSREMPSAMTSTSESVAAGDETMARRVALTPAAQRALSDFLAAADGVSRALASDSLEELRTPTAALRKAVSALVKEFETDHPWYPLLKHLQSVSEWPALTDLASSRETFLPFSTNVVALVQALRGQEESFRALKVYKCPMAPKPGLWFQAKGPLRNPYFGAEMLTCGSEVRAPSPAPSTVALTPEVPAPVEKAVGHPAPTSSGDAMPATNKTPTHREMDLGRMALRDELLKMRMTAIAEANAKKLVETNAPLGQRTNAPASVPQGGAVSGSQKQ